MRVSAVAARATFFSRFNFAYSLWLLDDLPSHVRFSEDRAVEQHAIPLGALYSERLISQSD